MSTHGGNCSVGDVDGESQGFNGAASALQDTPADKPPSGGSKGGSKGADRHGHGGAGRIWDEIKRKAGTVQHRLGDNAGSRLASRITHRLRRKSMSRDLETGLDVSPSPSVLDSPSRTRRMGSLRLGGGSGAHPLDSPRSVGKGGLSGTLESLVTPRSGSFGSSSLSSGEGGGARGQALAAALSASSSFSYRLSRTSSCMGSSGGNASPAPAEREAAGKAHGLSSSGSSGALAGPSRLLAEVRGKMAFVGGSGALMPTSGVRLGGGRDDDVDSDDDDDAMLVEGSASATGPTDAAMAAAVALADSLPGADGDGDSRGGAAQKGGERAGTVASSGVSGYAVLTREMVAACQEAVKQLQERIATLEQIKPTTRRRGFDELFDVLKRDKSPLPHHAGNGEASPPTVYQAILSVNREKNRYSDVLPYDSSRVKLDGPSRCASDGSDYINASHIQAACAQVEAADSGGDAAAARPPTEAVGEDMGLSMPRYIAAQGPLDNTVHDFWEMVWQQQCAAVIQLTREIEGNKIKCAHYCPSEPGSSEVYEHIRVTTLAKQQLPSYLGRVQGPAAAAAAAVAPTILRKLQLEDTQNPSRPLFAVLHFMYTDWPDHGVPRDTLSIRTLIRFLRTSRHAAGPFLVHCSAGIGRTGAYCTVDHTVRRVLRGDLAALDIPATIRHLRSQRAGMVQTKDQFRFCYLAVKEELEDIILEAAAGAAAPGGGGGGGGGGTPV